MKIITKLTVLFIIIILTGCEEENSDQSIIIQTDKAVYSVGESVYVEIINNYDNSISYGICSSYTGIPPIIWKYEENNWTAYWAPICNGFESYCCEQLEAHDSYEDLFELEFEKGRYRIDYLFIVAQEQESENFYSNEFIVE